MTEEKLWMIFKHFDVDDTNFISRENIVKAMEKLGKEITEDEINEAIEKHDIKQDGQISFEEFKIMFSKDYEDDDEDENK